MFCRRAHSSINIRLLRSTEVTKGALLRTFCGASSFYRGLAVLVPQYPPPSRLWRRPPHWHADSLHWITHQKCRPKRLQRSVPQRFRVGCWLLPPGKLSIVSLGSVEQGLHAQVTARYIKKYVGGWTAMLGQVLLYIPPHEPHCSAQHTSPSKMPEMPDPQLPDGGNGGQRAHIHTARIAQSMISKRVLMIQSTGGATT